MFCQPLFKIGIDARMYGAEQTGIGTYIRNLINNIALIDKKDQYVIFLSDKEFDGFKLPGLNFKKIKVSSHWYSWKEQIVLPFEFYRENLDLMHFPHFNAPILYFGKSITTIHDITPFFFPGHKMNSWARRLAFRLVFGSSVKKARKVIAVSRSTKRDIAKHFGVPEGKIEVVYEGVENNFKILPNCGKIKEELARRYGISKPFIFYVGVWRNHKNVTGLLKAFARLKEDLSGRYQLVLGGKEDPYYPEIKRAIRELDLEKDVITPGFISADELVLFYNACSLFVIPSFYEGFGLVGLEAFQCGVPVVSSNTTSLPEILGDAALYFDPCNEREMASVMEEALTNEETRIRMIKKGHEQGKKYSWEKMAAETHKIYLKVIESV